MTDRISLPIDEVLPELLATLRAHPALVLEAPPGAGKTTRVPPAILRSGLIGSGEVIVLEPRRLAARLSAKRVAEEMGERPGETVGYQVRFDEVSGPRTKLRYVTEGILARRLFADPELRGVGAVLLDEFHERHLQTDLALALLRRLQQTVRTDLKLVIMSATLDGAAIAEHLGCPAIRSAGRRFPVEIEYLMTPDDRRLGDQVAAAVRRVTVTGTEGDVLVFLPGAGEIRFAQEACAELAAHRALSLRALHGDLPPEEQDRALQRGGRKVILATNVAETSVTIEGVTAVIDTGLLRIASHSPWSGLPRLEVAKISRASAAQRAGRAGRTAPGRCLRLYTRADFESRPEQHAPELLRLDLAELVLELRAAGLDPETLPWLDQPPPAALAAAAALLKQLGALDAKEQVTPLGRSCARFPLHPRLSRLLLEAEARGAGAHGCALAALLGERDLRAGRDLRAATTSGTSDLDELLSLFARAARARFSADKLRGLGVDAGAARRVDRASDQIGRIIGIRGIKAAATEPTAGQETSLRIAALAAFPDRVCKRRAPGSHELTFASGAAARLADSSCVRDAALLVAVDVQDKFDARRDAAGRAIGQRGGALVRLAVAIEPEWLVDLDLLAAELRESTAFIWEPARERVEVQSRLSFGSLVLEESRRPPRLDDPAEAAQAAPLLIAHLRRGGGALEPALQAELDALKARVQLVAQHCPEAGLRPLEESDVEAALLQAALGAASLEELREELRAANLQATLIASLGTDAAGKLARLAPTEVALASGRRLRVEYLSGQPPAVRSRLQDFFGSAKGPAICNGRVSLVLHLLAPNGRAQQVTTDLEGFWTRHYPALRKELMRKYPRHSWPGDGRAAAPPMFPKR